MSGLNLKLIINLAIAAIPFVLMCLASETVNLKKPYRGHQFLSVIFGFLYSIAALLMYNRTINYILSLITKLVDFLLELGENRPRLSSVCENIATFLTNINWNLYMVFIGNFLFLALFLILKKILLPLFKKLWSNEDVYSATSGKFYEWSEALSSYCLKGNYFAVKNILKVYFIATCVLVSLLLVLYKYYPDWVGFKTVIYPFVTVIIVGELFYFIDGKTEAEYRSVVSGDDGSSRSRALYYPFKKYLTTMFGDRLVGEHTNFPSFNYTHNNGDIVKKYEKIESQEAQLVNLFFYKKSTTRDVVDADEDDILTTASVKNADKINGIQLDESLVDATHKLLNRESILFSTPFYNDYSDYIFLPINRALTRGSKVLVIICRNGIEENIKEWLNNSLENVINVPEMWQIDFLKEKEYFAGDVGIVTASDIFNAEIVNDNIDFISKVTEVILIEPSKFISTAQLSISVYISRVAKNAVYYIFDKNNDGLVDTMSHVIKKSIVTVTPTVSQRNINTYMMWQADGYHFSNRLFPSVARYLGVGTELIIAALKEQIRKGEWFSFNKFPIYEMRWISQQYYRVLCEYASIPSRQEELENRMLFNHDLWSAKKGKYKYLVVEDEFCNLFEVARQFSSRATSESFINIVSQNYLLREYMYLNPKLFTNDPKAIPSFSPDFVRTNRNISLELILKLYSGYLPESEVVKVLRYTGDGIFFEKYSSYDVKNAIYDLIFKYLNNFGAQSPEGLVEEHDKYYRLKKPSKGTPAYESLERTLNELKCAYYIVEDEEDNTNYLDAKLFGQVYQSHLPGQHIVLGGKYYEILLIGNERGVVLKRAGDHVQTREYYRQFRNYIFDSFVADESIGSKSTFGNIILDRGIAQFSVETDGYLLMKDYGDIFNECFKKDMNHIPSRSYKGKTTVRLTFPNITERQRVTIALVLNEVFKTIYPEDCDFICALTNIGDDIPDGLMYKFSFDEQENENCIYIVEDSTLDMGLLSSFQRNFSRIFEIVTDYLSWHEDMLTYAPKPKEPVNIKVPPQPAPQDDGQNKPKKKKGIFSGIKDKIKSIFGRKNPKTPKGKKGKPEEGQGVNPPEDETDEIEEESETNFSGNDISLAKKQLSEKELRIYDELLEQIRSFKSEFVIENAQDYEEISKAFKAVIADFPEFFWLNGGCSWTSKTQDSKKTFTITPNLYKSMEEFKPMYEALMKKVDELVGLAQKQTTAFKKVLFVHDWIVDDCEYDQETCDKIDKGDTDMFLPATKAYGCLVDGKAVCSGYAAAFQIVMNKLGAECGRSTGAAHAWNYIKLDDEYYYIDVTWDDPCSDNKVESDVEDTNLSHEYFCITTDELLKTHTIDGRDPAPLAKATKYDYFIHEKRYLEKYSFEDVEKIIKANIGEKKLQIKFSSKLEREKAENDLFSNKRIFEIDGIHEIMHSVGKSGLVLSLFF